MISKSEHSYHCKHLVNNFHELDKCSSERKAWRLMAVPN
jgi:hypothetical protein